MKLLGNKSRRTRAFVLVFAAAISTCGILAFADLSKEVKAKRDELDRVSLGGIDLVQCRERARIAEVESRKAYDDLKLDTEMHFPELEQADVVKVISEAAKRKGLLIKDMAFSGESKEEAEGMEFSSQTFSLVLEGAYNSLKDALEDIEDSHKNFRVDSLKVEPGDDGEVVATIVLKIYKVSSSVAEEIGTSHVWAESELKAASTPFSKSGAEGKASDRSEEKDDDGVSEKPKQEKRGRDKEDQVRVASGGSHSSDGANSAENKKATVRSELVDSIEQKRKTIALNLSAREREGEADLELLRIEYEAEKDEKAMFDFDQAIEIQNGERLAVRLRAEAETDDNMGFILEDVSGQEVELEVLDGIPVVFEELEVDVPGGKGLEFPLVLKSIYFRGQKDSGPKGAVIISRMEVVER